MATRRSTHRAVVLLFCLATLLAVTVRCGGGSDPVLGGNSADTIDGGAGPDVLSPPAGNGAIDDAVDGGAGDDPIATADGEAEVVPGGADDSPIATGDGADVVPGEAGDDPVATGDGADVVPGDDQLLDTVPFSIALMAENAGALTPLERSLTTMLEGNGHTVTPFSVNAEPIVNAANNPTIDLLLFSPSFVFSVLYHPAQADSLPMLDMARNSWYRRYVVPWGDEIVGPRYSTITDFSESVFYDDAGVIPWAGQQVGPVPVLTTQRFSGGATMRSVIDYSTDGAAQHFLRHVSDTGAESTLGVYVPPGSTITEPAPTVAEERRLTSVAPWIGLVVFNDDGGDGNQYGELTAAGEGLFEAAIVRLMNP